MFNNILKFVFGFLCWMFLICCNPYSQNPDNWPNIYLGVTLNKEQLVYKIGDTLKLIVTVPDSLPSLTIQGEKVKVHSINEAYLKLELSEIDTINKRGIPLNEQLLLFAEKGNIEVRKNMYGHNGTFNNMEKPFGITLNMVFKKPGLYSFRTAQAQKFIANNGNYRAGVLYNMNVADNNFFYEARHFKNPDGTSITHSPFIYYVFYVK